MILLDKQILAPSDVRYGCNMRHDGRNFDLDMVLSPKYMSMKPGGGLEEPQGGTPQYMKKTSMFKNDF